MVVGGAAAAKGQAKQFAGLAVAKRVLAAGVGLDDEAGEGTLKIAAGLADQGRGQTGRGNRTRSCQTIRPC